MLRVVLCAIFIDTCWIDDVSVATTSSVVSVTMILSVKFPTWKNSDMKPTQVNTKVWRNILVTWYSIRRLNTIFTTAWLTFFIVCISIVSSKIWYSTRVLDVAVWQMQYLEKRLCAPWAATRTFKFYSWTVLLQDYVIFGRAFGLEPHHAHLNVEWIVLEIKFARVV